MKCFQWVSSMLVDLLLKWYGIILVLLGVQFFCNFETYLKHEMI